MRTLRTLALAGLLSLLPSAGLRAGEPPALTGEITAEELSLHVRILASDAMNGRRSGTPDGERAAAYVASQFEAAGLKPGGDEGTWLQWFGLPGGDPDPEGSSFLVTREDATVTAPSMGGGWLPFSFAQAGVIRDAGIVFAGYGLRAPELGWDDYSGVDVKGKIVVVLRHGPRERDAGNRFGGPNLIHLTFVRKAEVAEKAGAAAMLLVNDSYHHPGEPDRCPTRIPAASGAVQIPAAFLARAEAEKIFAAAGMDLPGLEKEMDADDRPRSRALPGLRASLALSMKSSRTANVIGLIPGSDPALSDQAIVIGAHYDHLGTDGAGALDPEAAGAIRNGADDNASGTAAVIELAERFALAAERPARTLIFIAFAGEELGLLGSRHYVEHPIHPIPSTAAMINLDMIGRAGEAGLFVGGTGTSPVFDDILTEASEGLSLKIRRSPSGFAPSDNASFYAVGVPCFFLHTGLHADYHRATDDWDKLDYATEETIARLAGRLADRLTRIPRIPLAPRLGVRLRPSRDATVVVGSVERGSPAAKAGIRPGDRIVKLGGTDVRGLEELQQALGGLGIGDSAEVRVVRGTEALKLTVKF